MILSFSCVFQKIGAVHPRNYRYWPLLRGHTLLAQNRYLLTKKLKINL